MTASATTDPAVPTLEAPRLTAATRDGGSFRDPSGFVFWHDGQPYRQINRRLRYRPHLPLVLDLANPSPGLGWAGRERRSLLERADADVVLALALAHHLAISRNVPLPMILGLFADLAPWAIVEFVAKEDPMVRRLLASRRDVFDDYGLPAFRAAAAARFEIIAESTIAESLRVLFLLRRR